MKLHAIERFMERSGEQDQEKAFGALVRMLRRSKYAYTVRRPIEPFEVRTYRDWKFVIKVDKTQQKRVKMVITCMRKGQ